MSSVDDKIPLGFQLVVEVSLTQGAGTGAYRRIIDQLRPVTSMNSQQLFGTKIETRGDLPCKYIIYTVTQKLKFFSVQIFLMFWLIFYNNLNQVQLVFCMFLSFRKKILNLI